MDICGFQKFDLLVNISYPSFSLLSVFPMLMKILPSVLEVARHRNQISKFRLFLHNVLYFILFFVKNLFLTPFLIVGKIRSLY